MKTWIILLLMITIPIMILGAENLQKLWNEMEDREDNGLYKSAMEKADQIIDKSRKAKDYDNMLWGVYHKLNYLGELEEESDTLFFQQMKEYIVETPQPAKNILHNIMAEAYFSYLNRNYFRILERTETDQLLDDIRTWSINQILEKALDEIQLSLANENLLQNTPVNKYPLLISQSKDSERRPVLYDLLIFKSIDYLRSGRDYSTAPINAFKLNSKDYFAPVEEFVKIEIQSDDKLSLEYNIILLYQQLLRYHLEAENKIALFDMDLHRINYVKNFNSNNKKEQLYVNALEQLIESYQDEEYSSEAAADLAEFYARRNSRYQDFEKDSEQNDYTLAYNLCNSTIEQYPDSRGAIRCRNLKKNIEDKSASFRLEEVYLPQKPVICKINYKNLDHINYRIFKTDGTIERRRSIEIVQKLINGKSPILEGIWELEEEYDFQDHSTEVNVGSFEVGNYILLISHDKNFEDSDNILAYNYFTVSQIAYTIRRYDNIQEVLLLDRKTGEILEGIKTEVWKKYYDYKIRKEVQEKTNLEFISSKEGLIKINIPLSGLDENERFYLKFIKGLDELFSSELNNYYYRSGENNRAKTHLFTDRKIYRPGQTVFFKGIAVQSKGDERSALSKSEIKVEFLDVNYQEISEQKFVTNDYGSFHGSFEIPTGGLTGNFQISTAFGNAFIKVEEYKRPKFEVIVDPVTETFVVGDTISLTGFAKAFAGFNLDNTAVEYQIYKTTQMPYWYRFWYPNEEELLSYGTIRSDLEGKFELNFEAKGDTLVDKTADPVYHYRIKVAVTDLNGETQEATSHVKVGYNLFRLDVAVADQIDKQAKFQNISIYSKNYNGQMVDSHGNIEIYKLNSPDKIYQKKYWTQPDRQFIPKPKYEEFFPYSIFYNENQMKEWQIERLVKHLSFDTSESQSYKLDKLNKFDQGAYKIIVTSYDELNNYIKSEIYFTLYDSESKELPYPKTDWIVPIKTTCEPGEKAEFLVGTSYPDTEILMEVDRDGIIKKKWYKFDNNQKIISVPISEEDRGNIAVNFIFVRENRFYHLNQTVYVPWSNKELMLEFATFRDKLAPGEKETWKIKIRDNLGEQVMAELAAVLYDKSLDTFASNNWYFNIFPSRYSNLQWQADKGFSSLYSIGLVDYQEDYENIRPVDYPYLKNDINWYRIFPGHSLGGFRFSKNVALASEYAEHEDSSLLQIDSETIQNLPVRSGGFSADGNEIDEDKEGSPESEISMEDVEIRSNFNETAFFYPDLQTDEEGNIVFSFTIPQSLTRWKMMGLAHTKDLMSGTIFGELETRKDLMIIPNAPRFLRVGDTIEFSAKITNLSNVSLDGKAELQLYDALTMKPVDNAFQLISPQIPFALKQDQSTLVTWNLVIPDTISALTYRVFAKAGNFSDGEEMTLPILSNRMLVTESLPLPVRENQTKNFVFEKLKNSDDSKTLKHHKLTLEYTANPAWYAIQALPYLMDYPYECSEQIFSRFYANSIATHIINSNDKIKRVFDNWKNSEDKSALLSNLEKNQELKSLLIEETPWLLDAKNESERKKRIGLLFDLNKMSRELDEALLKMQQNQSVNGGWPWFKGMRESRYITQHIVAGMGHLQRLGVRSAYDSTTMDMIKMAVSYLDVRIKEDYNNLIKRKSNLDSDHLGYIQIHYLYARSFFPEVKMEKDVDEAFAYYLNQADKYWLKKSIYMQGMLALALNRFEKELTPSKILASLEERASHSEEMGMYWKDIVLGLSWFDAPIETQAVLIEAFDEVAARDDLVNEMKVWLLKQKQVQDWKTTKATVEACYALLLRGTDYLSESELPEITIGDESLVIEEIDGVTPEAGTGYFKTSWSKGEIQSNMAEVVVSNKNDVVSWGAMYWQYFEDLDKITPHETPISLKKDLFVEKMTDNGKKLFKIDKDNSPSIGERVIVRIEIRVDRDMEYVHMKDMRASCLEPENVFSRYKWQDGLGYYESTRDASTNFFFDYLSKGTYVFQYPVRVTHIGNYSNGITTIQSMYAPEFSSHSKGIRLSIENK